MNGTPTRPFYFIRHGETDWNHQQKLQGHSDIPLNALGRTQAATLIEFIKDLPDPKIYSSDLKRAHETAKIAAPHHEPSLDARLREVNLGDAEGTFRYDLETKFGPEIVKAWFSNDAESLLKRFPNGESRKEAIERVLATLEERAPEMTTNTLIFFAHGLLMRSLAEAAILMGGPTDLNKFEGNLRAPNCSVFEFEWSKNKPRLRQILWFHPTP